MMAGFGLTIHCTCELVVLFNVRNSFNVSNVGGWTANIKFSIIKVVCILNFFLVNQEALEAKQFYGEERKLQKGDVTAALKDAECVIEGQMHITGQEHFYMETQGCLIIPTGEDDELQIFSSTQFPATLQVF